MTMLLPPVGRCQITMARPSWSNAACVLPPEPTFTGCRQAAFGPGRTAACTELPSQVAIAAPAGLTAIRGNGPKNQDFRV
jgi:hypothetical protein